MRDCAGPEDESEPSSELESSRGPGDAGTDSVGDALAVVVMGREERRRRRGPGDTGRPGSLSGLGEEAPPAALRPGTAVPADEFLEICGLMPTPPYAAGSLPLKPGVPGPSLRGSGESLRTDKAEGALPPPEPVRLIASAARTALSEPEGGTGVEVLDTVVALRSWARTWDA